MASGTKKLKAKKKWKNRPNKANRREDMKRIQKNTEILRALAAEEKS
jgi:hypothetical protein